MPGPLLPEHLDTIGRELYRLAIYRELEFTIIAGIPNAGDPFADAFNRASGNLYRVFRYGKKVEDGKRHIVGLVSGKNVPGDIQLSIDDLVTKADTKFEAIDAARAEGITVKDIVVLIDREQGGAKQLAERGVRLHAAFPLHELLEFYVHDRTVTESKALEVMDYLAANS